MHPLPHRLLQLQDRQLKRQRLPAVPCGRRDLSRRGRLRHPRGVLEAQLDPIEVFQCAFRSQCKGINATEVYLLEHSYRWNYAQLDFTGEGCVPGGMYPDTLGRCHECPEGQIVLQILVIIALVAVAVIAFALRGHLQLPTTLTIAWASSSR